jgi:hypothetical protein
MMKKSLMMIACAPAVLAASAFRWTDLPPQLLPVYGGSGGTAFTRECGTGYVLTGIRVRSGIYLDAIGVLCRQVRSDGTLGSETTVGTLSGGGGGTSATASCPSGKVVAKARMSFSSYAEFLYIFCRDWHSSTRTVGPSTTETVNFVGNTFSTANWATEACESTAQPARGIRGRSAVFVDALGFICDEP